MKVFKDPDQNNFNLTYNNNIKNLIFYQTFKIGYLASVSDSEAPAEADLSGAEAGPEIFGQIRLVFKPSSQEILTF